MHLLFSVSMAPSLQEVTPLPRARGFTPLMRPIIAAPYSSQLGRGRARI
jgi:hypothetical protein